MLALLTGLYLKRKKKLNNYKKNVNYWLKGAYLKHPFFLLANKYYFCSTQKTFMKLILSLLMIISSLFLYSQKDVGQEAAENIVIKTDSTTKKWDIGGNASVFLSQVAFINWAAGGVSSISGLLNANVFAKLHKKKHSWETDFTVEYGIMKNQGDPVLKNRDLWVLNSKYGYQVNKKGNIYIGSLLKFESQFMPGFNNIEDSTYTTNFLAPGKLILAVGINLKPKKYFSLFFSPAAGKFTFVLDNNVNPTTFGLDQNQRIRTEFGAYLKADFEKELFKNFIIKSTLTLFNNYLDNSTDTILKNNIQTIKHNRANIDIDWLFGADLVFNEWLTVNISTQLIYDHDVKINLTEKDGKTPILKANGEQKTGPRTQFTESFSIGLKYRFKPKEKE